MNPKHLCAVSSPMHINHIILGHLEHCLGIGSAFSNSAFHTSVASFSPFTGACHWPPAADAEAHGAACDGRNFLQICSKSPPKKRRCVGYTRQTRIQKTPPSDAIADLYEIARVTQPASQSCPRRFPSVSRPIALSDTLYDFADRVYVGALTVRFIAGNVAGPVSHSLECRRLSEAGSRLVVVVGRWTSHHMLLTDYACNLSYVTFPTLHFY